VAVDASEQQTIAAMLREDTPPKDEPDYSDRLLQALLRQAALTGRYAASGVGGMGAAFANPLAYGANKGLEAVGSDYRFPEQHGALMGALTDMGVPEPQGTMEKAVGFASEIGVPDPTDSAKLVSSLSHMIDPNLAATAFHGSPHKFTKFDMEKIGTGEGAQAYGHGLYFAESPGVAKSYKNNLSMQDVMVDGKPAYQLEGLEDNTPPEQAIRTVLSEGGIDEAISKLKHLESIDKETPKYWADAYKWLSENRKRISLEGGSLYEVDIPDTAINKMLDWDKPLSEQPESVRLALQDFLDDIINREPDYHRASEFARRFSIEKMGDKTGEDLYRTLSSLTGGDEGVSTSLNMSGIPGIKYFDGSSRATSGGKLLGLFEDSGKWKAKVKVSNRGGVGFQSPTDTVTTSKAFDTKEEAEAWANSKINSGTRNFVVFNEKYVKPLKRDGKPIKEK
jgi:hypothetical protein